MKHIALLACLILALCAALPCALADNGVVNVYNWEDYISEEAKELFEQETGIKINYMCFTTNEDMLIQVEANPAAFDVVFPSDYCVERMVAKGMLAPINFDSIPNAKHIMPSLQNPAYDPDNLYSIPYMWGTVGILYNTELLNEAPTSWKTLFDEKNAGQVFMMDSIRDTLGVTLKYLGYSMNTRDPLQLQEATQLLIWQKQAGIVKAYQVDETKDKMIAGEAALALMWSGDAQYAIDSNDALRYVVPDEGSNIWVDAMVIPKEAKNKANAEAFINFMCRPDIAVLNCEEIRYSSPNTDAIALMGDEYSQNHVLNPDAETVAGCEFFNDIQDFMTIYNTLWSQIKNAK